MLHIMDVMDIEEILEATNLHLQYTNTSYSNQTVLFEQKTLETGGTKILHFASKQIVINGEKRNVSVREVTFTSYMMCMCPPLKKCSLMGTVYPFKQLKTACLPFSISLKSTQDR